MASPCPVELSYQFNYAISMFNPGAHTRKFKMWKTSLIHVCPSSESILMAPVISILWCHKGSKGLHFQPIKVQVKATSREWMVKGLKMPPSSNFAFFSVPPSVIYSRINDVRSNYRYPSLCTVAVKSLLLISTPMDLDSVPFLCVFFPIQGKYA